MKLITKTSLPNTVIRTRCKRCGAIVEFESNDVKQRIIDHTRPSKMSGFWGLINFASRIVQHTKAIAVIAECPSCQTDIVEIPDQPLIWSEPYADEY